jgi:hypothetical protein
MEIGPGTYKWNQMSNAKCTCKMDIAKYAEAVGRTWNSTCPCQVENNDWYEEGDTHKDQAADIHKYCKKGTNIKIEDLSLVFRSVYTPSYPKRSKGFDKLEIKDDILPLSQSRLQQYLNIDENCVI